MSNTWPPQQEPPPQAGWPQSWSPSQPPSYEDADYGYGGYGAPGPSSSGRPGGWTPQRGEPSSQWGGAPAQQQWGGAPEQRQYQLGRPSPHMPQYPQAPYGVQGPYGQYGPYGPRPSPSRRSHNRLLPVVVLVVFGFLVAAGGAYAVARFGPAATTTQGSAASQTHGAPAGGFRTYTDTAVRVRLDVPDGWTTNDQATSVGPAVQATSPDDTATMFVGAIPGGGNEVGAANGAMAGVADSGKVDNKEGPSQVTFGGATWVREAGDLTRSGTRLHMVIFVATHGKSTYFLGFIATVSTFAAADARYFQYTTQSFQFLS